ncbi:hypothetical protein [Ectopseudomonas mendocina]|uniref:hypothetical protein n=1 Tax=Ectopseudomonas mendocina TaxID=300 RepID=UPI0005A143B9|nr:hypothetical protein [Pseudomonas mendocina]
MLRAGPKRKFLYNAASKVYVIAGVSCSFILWLMDLEGDEPWVAKGWVWGLIHEVQGFAIYILAFFAILSLVCMFVKQGSDPWVQEKLQYILDSYRDRIFSEGEFTYDRDRITLFKYEKGLWFRKHWNERSTKWWRIFKTRRPYGDYLVPYMRSGHMALKTKTVFYIDSENESNCEGVAGEAWARREVASRPDLPEILPTTGKKIKESYAKVTKSSVLFLDKYLNEGRIPPRSIVAMPVECSDGSLWGVIVLDSQKVMGVTTESANNYRLTVAMIGQLVERV